MMVFDQNYLIFLKNLVVRSSVACPNIDHPLVETL
jgi:hypothetical protein